MSGSFTKVKIYNKWYPGIGESFTMWNQPSDSF